MSESNIVVWVTAYSTLLRIVLAAVLVLAGLLGARAFRALFQLIRSRFEPHWPEWVQILFNGFTEPTILFGRCLLWYSAFLALPWPESWVPGLSGGAATALSIAAALLLTRGLWNSARICQLLLRSTQNKLDLETNKTMNLFFEKIYRALVFLFGCIQILTILGFDVNALIAGAGVCGHCVSLGAQSTLSNLIAGVALVIERPFGIGDWIVLGSFEGTVEDISFRSTRIRALDQQRDHGGELQGQRRVYLQHHHPFQPAVQLHRGPDLRHPAGDAGAAVHRSGGHDERRRPGDRRQRRGDAVRVQRLQHRP